MLNTVTLLGRLGKDVLVKTVGETTVSTLSIATNRSFKKDGQWQEATDWNRVEFWGLSEKVQALLLKGTRVVINGSLRTNTWEVEGKVNSSTLVRGNFVRILDKITNMPVAETQVTPTKEEEAFTAKDGEDLPF